MVGQCLTFWSPADLQNQNKILHHKLFFLSPSYSPFLHSLPCSRPFSLPLSLTLEPKAIWHLQKTFPGWWWWVCELAAWVLPRPLSLGGSFVWVPIYSQLAWAPMDELKLCECGALELGQSFSGTRVSIFLVEVGQGKQRPNSNNSRQILEKRTLIACKGVTVCRTVQDFSLLCYLFDLNTGSLSLISKPFLFLWWFTCSFLFNFKFIYYNCFINFRSVL